MGMGFAPTWLRQVTPPPLHKTTLTTARKYRLSHSEGQRASDGIRVSETQLMDSNARSLRCATQQIVIGAFPR